MGLKASVLDAKTARRVKMEDSFVISFDCFFLFFRFVMGTIRIAFSFACWVWLIRTFLGAAGVFVRCGCGELLALRSDLSGKIDTFNLGQ